MRRMRDARLIRLDDATLGPAVVDPNRLGGPPVRPGAIFRIMWNVPVDGELSAEDAADVALYKVSLIYRVATVPVSNLTRIPAGLQTRQMPRIAKGWDENAGAYRMILYLGQEVDQLISCRTCGKEASDDTKLKQCSRCKNALYCSSDCQKADWFSGHRGNCKTE